MALDVFIEWLYIDAQLHFNSENVVKSYTQEAYNKYVLEKTEGPVSDDEDEEFVDSDLNAEARPFFCNPNNPFNPIAVYEEEPEDERTDFDMNLIYGYLDQAQENMSLMMEAQIDSTHATINSVRRAEESLRETAALTAEEHQRFTGFLSELVKTPKEPTEAYHEDPAGAAKRGRRATIKSEFNTSGHAYLVAHDGLDEEHIMASLAKMQPFYFQNNFMNKNIQSAIAITEQLLGRTITPSLLYFIGHLVHLNGIDKLLAQIRATRINRTGNKRCADIFDYTMPASEKLCYVLSEFADIVDEISGDHEGRFISTYRRILHHAQIALEEKMSETFFVSTTTAGIEKLTNAYKKRGFLHTLEHIGEAQFSKFTSWIANLPFISKFLIGICVVKAGKVIISGLCSIFRLFFNHALRPLGRQVSAASQKIGLTDKMVVARDTCKTFLTTSREVFVEFAGRLYRKSTTRIAGGAEIEILTEVTESYDGTNHPRAQTKRTAPAIEPTLLTAGAGSPFETIMDNVVKPSLTIMSGHFQDARGKSMVYCIHVLPLAGQFFLSTRHQWLVLKSYAPTSFTLQNTSTYIALESAALKVYSLRADCDAVVIQIVDTRVPSARALYKHFISRENVGKMARCRVVLLTASANEQYRSCFEFTTPRTYTQISDVAQLDDKKSSAYNNTLGESFETLGTWKYATSMNGACGLPIICGEQSCGNLLGIHISGDSNLGVGRAALLTREDFEEFFEYIKVKPVSAPSLPATPVPPEHRLLTAGDYNIFSEHLPENMQSHLPTKADFKKMPCYERFTPNDREPAPLSDYDKRNIYNENIIKNCTAKYKNVDKPFPIEYIQKFREGFSQEVNTLPDTYQIGLLSQDEAINGIFNTHVERMNMDSSPGFPFTSWPSVKAKTGKKGLFHQDGSLEEPHYTPTPEFQAEIDALYDSWKEGERLPTYYKDAQKVELLNFKKTRPHLFRKLATGDEKEIVPIYEGPRQVDTRIPLPGDQIEPTRTFKCRLINTPAAHRTVISRIYNAGFNALLMENRHRIGIMPGINPCSSEWGMIVDKIHQFAPTMNDTDFENFDGVHQRQVIQMISEIYASYLERFPEFRDSEEHHTAQQACWDELITRHVLVKDLGYVVLHGLASGHDCTTQINCIAQIFYFFVAWMEIMKEAKPELANYSDFRRYFIAIVYGDDGLWTAILALQHIVTAARVASVLKEYGITLTAASKFVKGFEAPKPIARVTFLSRSFVAHSKYPNVYYAPLKDESRDALLNWAYVKGRTLFEATADNVDQFLRHSHPLGPSYHRKRLQKLAEILPEFLAGKVFPTWGELEEKFLEDWGYALGNAVPEGDVPYICRTSSCHVPIGMPIVSLASGLSNTIIVA